MILPKTFIEPSACMFVIKADNDMKQYKNYGMLSLRIFTYSDAPDFILYTHDAVITNYIKDYCYRYLGKCL